jgi:hypothetical protein
MKRGQEEFQVEVIALVPERQNSSAHESRDEKWPGPGGCTS